ncbi:MAG TPA: glycine betaine ABC transporter substrate-binding protein [Novosphingobium sp.]|nr:glycine betaine ABC transporter substrate-binding protein [Novosphingobium sp.]
MRWLAAILGLLLLVLPAHAQTIGSKKFTESVILGEIAREALEMEGIEAIHRRELGGSRILWDALLAGEIDVYPEYTGTLRFELLSSENMASDAGLPAALLRHGVVMSRPIGFSNGYALAMRKDVARRLGIRTISDLARHPDIDIALSNEFVDRTDGWPKLSHAYGLGAVPVRGIDHDLAYRALDARQIDVTDAYTTDAEIAAYDLVLLADDRAFFPRYDAVFLYRPGIGPKAAAALDRLGGTLDEARMQRLNRMVRIDGMTETTAARDFVGGQLTPETGFSPWRTIVQYTFEHLFLVTVALLAAIMIALPLGVLAARNRRLGAAVLSLTGILQTIPSLALFVMLIPLLGIGAAPTIAALFLYSLLPIVRNTHAGLTGISPALIDSADALGLSRMARLRRIEFPLALPTIMAGVRTAAVIAVGLATLGAIIGAGGYGQPILTGIRLANTRTILSGTIPAAVMALLIDGMFHFVQIAVTPRGLRIPSSRA